MKRAVLHSDLNAFFASVETVLHPEYEGEAMAVCGSEEDRHGIVLAKSEKAKRAGVRTGMAIWEAKRACPGLLIADPHYDAYLKFSRLVRGIYRRYSDLVEPFGLDECWIDVTGSQSLFGTPEEIAHAIRRTVREELGLTVSVGVSFNKVFAKLGSDLKKPDAVSVIGEDNFRQMLWPLPVSSLLYAGPATVQRLARMDIRTIGELAQTDQCLLERILGAGGTQLWRYANGLDTSRVMREDEVIPLQSVSHGMTCNADLESDWEVQAVMLELSQEIGRRLEEAGLSATGIQIEIRDCHLQKKQIMTSLPFPTRSRRILAEEAFVLYKSRLKSLKRTDRDGIRSVTVRATRLIRENGDRQLDLFGDSEKTDRLDKLEKAMDEVTDRYGRDALLPADILANPKTKCNIRQISVLPHGGARPPRGR